jgi:hypothetical protein
MEVVIKVKKIVSIPDAAAQTRCHSRDNKMPNQIDHPALLGNII